MSGKNNKFNFFFIGLFFLFSFSLVLNASVSLNDYPQIKSSWDDGELASAIAQLQKELEKRSDNDKVAELLKKITFQKSKLDQWIDKAILLLEQQKFEEAKEILAFAKTINPNYSPYRNLVNKVKITEEELKYPSKVIFDGSLGKQWKELAAYGGDFKKFARIENKVLVVDVPKGNNWGKTGIRSAEAFVKIPEKDEKFAKKINFSFDSSRSSDFILAIIPSNWDGNLEWRSHYIRVGVQRSEENKNSFLTLWIKGREIMKVNIDPESIQQLSIVMRPDRLILVTDGSDNIFLQGFLPENQPIFKEGYKISVLTHAPKKGMTATLALKEITLAQAPYDKIADVSLLQNKPQKITLFDGKMMGQRWKPYVNAKTKFDNTVKLSNGALYVDVPEKVGHANIGIESREPLIWLDQFGKDSKREVIFNFIPKQTTGFAIALSNKTNHFIVKWFKNTEKNKAYLQIYLSNNLGLISNWNSSYKPVWEKEVSTTAPEELKLILTPEGITLSGDQLPEHFQMWTYLRANAGYYIYVYSFPVVPNQAVKMALKEISLDNKILKPSIQAKPISGISPLPIVDFFSENNHEEWELTPWQIYKKPVKSCHLNETGFSVSSVPENTPLDGCDIHTDKPMVNIDKRLDGANYQISVQFDPQKTKNFRIAVTPQKRHNWNKYYRACYLNLLQSETRQNVFSFNCGAKNYWQRSVTTEWLNNKWNGRVNILMGKEWMQGELEGGIKIRINSARSGKLYLYIVAPDYHYKETSAEFLLTKITGQWLAPDGMSAMDRWRFVDDEDFDADAFLNELADTMPKPIIRK